MRQSQVWVSWASEQPMGWCEQLRLRRIIFFFFFCWGAIPGVNFASGVWFKQDLVTQHHSTFKAEYNQLHNKQKGLYKYSPIIKRVKLQARILKTTRRKVVFQNFAARTETLSAWCGQFIKLAPGPRPAIRLGRTQELKYNHYHYHLSLNREGR